MTAIRNHRGILAVRAELPDAVASAIGEFSADFDKFKERESAKIKTLEANLIEMEQRLAERDLAPRGGARRSPGAALADKLTKADGWGSVADKRLSKTSVAVDAGTMLNVQANTVKYDNGGFNVNDRQAEIVSGMQRKRWLRDRIAMIPTTGGAVEFTRELAFTNNAAPQGGGSPFEHEGVAKAESSITYEQVELKVPTVAHFIKASRQILGDVPLLRQTLDSRLLYGLEVVLENQILNGTGVGANMSGLTKSGNHTAFTPTSGDTAIDSISRAIAALEASESQPDVIVLHPADLGAMRRLKSSGSGEFLFGAPAGQNAEGVWNRDIHVTPAMTQGKFLAMDSVQMGVLFLREDASVQVGYVNDDFTKNLVVLLAELRATIAVQRPAAVQYGSLTL